MISVGTTIKILASGFLLINNSLSVNAVRVFPNPVGSNQLEEPPASNHRFIQSFCRSVLSIKIM